MTTIDGSCWVLCEIRQRVEACNDHINIQTAQHLVQCTSSQIVKRNEHVSASCGWCWCIQDHWLLCVWGRHWNMCRHIVLCVPILACYVCSTQQLTSRVRFICLLSGTCHVLLSDNLNCLASSTCWMFWPLNPVCGCVLLFSLHHCVLLTAHTAQTISCQCTFSILPSILALERFGVNYWTDSMNSDRWKYTEK